MQDVGSLAIWQIFAADPHLKKFWKSSLKYPDATPLNNEYQTSSGAQLFGKV